MENKIMNKLYELYKQYPVICTDTRLNKPDSLFFCLKGDTFDGNRFALVAAEQGAKIVVTEDKTLAKNSRFFVVDDTLACLQQLAHYHRQQLSIPIIGITGTNGKTTTKELVAAVTSQKYKTASTQGNLNNHIGVPLTLLSIRSDDQIAIVEMGANHVGEIAELCQIALPTHAIITNIGTAHIEGFGSKENIINTKTALYRSVIESKGYIFVNANDPIILKYCGDYQKDKIIFYGQNMQKKLTSPQEHNSPYLHIQLFGQAIKTQLTGEYNLSNIWAAAATGRFFNVPEKDIITAIAQYMPTNRRSQILRMGSNTVIADYYNANPSSMTAAIHNLAQLAQKPKIAILGDMLELGTVSSTEHQKIVALCAQLNIKVYFVGKEFYRHAPPLSCFENVAAFNAYIAMHKIQDHLILIKGSRGIHLEQVEL